jgi:hypothetical protein
MRMAKRRKQTPWYLIPFVALWKLIAAIVALTGRLVAVILGFALMLVGILLTVTVIGAIAGIPLLIIGFLLVLKGIF